MDKDVDSRYTLSMSKQLSFLATSAYGLEGVLAKEIRDLGYETGDIQTSRVEFYGDEAALARANLFLRTAGRVRLIAGTFRAVTFDELYERTRAVAWEDLLPRDAAVPVTARCVSSALMSLSDCQRIVKKAIADRLCGVYGLSRLPESGSEYPIELHIFQDEATLSLDTSGEPLHRRGYRRLNGPAAIRETLAAAMVDLSHWDGRRALADPFCGTGTIVIEAAMKERHIAPGSRRTFGAEAWGLISEDVWRTARQEAHDLEEPRRALEIIGSDIDENAISMARYHARAAGVPDLRFVQKDVKDFTSPYAYGHIITNPPYGKRMSHEDTQVFRSLGAVWKKLPHWSAHVICAYPEFERAFGAKASGRRVLFNGQIACRYYQFYGERPPRGWTMKKETRSDRTGSGESGDSVE